MKAFLQHDESGLFYHERGWVRSVSDARAFTTVEEAERYRENRKVSTAHAVGRIDPALIARFLTKPPGRYQAGE